MLKKVEDEYCVIIPFTHIDCFHGPGHEQCRAGDDWLVHLENANTKKRRVN